MRMSCTPVIMPVVITSPARSGRPRFAHFASVNASALERTVAHGRGPATDQFVVDEAQRDDFMQRAPAGNGAAHDDAPVVAEVRYDGAWAEIVQRGERAAGDFDSDAQLADVSGRFFDRPVGLVCRRVGADANDELSFDGRKAPIEDRTLDDFPGPRHANDCS